MSFESRSNTEQKVDQFDLFGPNKKGPNSPLNKEKKLEKNARERKKRKDRERKSEFLVLSLPALRERKNRSLSGGRFPPESGLLSLSLPAEVPAGREREGKWTTLSLFWRKLPPR